METGLRADVNQPVGTPTCSRVPSARLTNSQGTVLYLQQTRTFPATRQIGYLNATNRREGFQHVLLLSVA
jgi:hypothetical protein